MKVSIPRKNCNALIVRVRKDLVGEENALGAAVVAAVKSGESLSGALLRGAVVQGSIANADLSDSELVDCRISGDASGVNLEHSVMTGVTISAKLSGASLRGARMNSSLVQHCRGEAVDMVGAHITSSNIRHCSFPGAQMIRVVMDRVSVHKTDLSNARMFHSTLDGLSMEDSSLFGANLSDGRLVGVSLTNVNLAGCSFLDARMSRAENCARYGSAVPPLVVDAGARSDGYSFYGWVKEGRLWVNAGCRSFSVAQGRRHWTKTRGGTSLGRETDLILQHLVSLADRRSLVKTWKRMVGQGSQPVPPIQDEDGGDEYRVLTVEAAQPQPEAAEQG